jgi:hypothetical protein
MKVPDFIIKFFGKRMAVKLQLQEGNLENKKWYQSKTIWVAVVTAVLGLYTAIGAVVHLPPIPEWIYTLLAALGLYGLRTAEKPIE